MRNQLAEDAGVDVQAGELRAQAVMQVAPDGLPFARGDVQYLLFQAPALGDVAHRDGNAGADAVLAHQERAAFEIFGARRRGPIVLVRHRLRALQYAVKLGRHGIARR